MSPEDGFAGQRKTRGKKRKRSAKLQSMFIVRQSTRSGSESEPEEEPGTILRPSEIIWKDAEQEGNLIGSS